jgi:hypothetical protein
MRVRKLDKNWDYQFGRGSADFIINMPEAVGQSVVTRLKLWRGEWFVQPSDGTPWMTEITGAHTQGLRDMAIKARILQTPGVVAITNYFSTLDPSTRHFSVSATINTIYGTTQLSTDISGAKP